MPLKNAPRPIALMEAASDAGDALKRVGEVGREEAQKASSQTKEYLSDKPEEYQAGAKQRLSELDAEIKQLRQRTKALSDRRYLATQLQALDQHYQFATTQFSNSSRTRSRRARRGTPGIRLDIAEPRRASQGDKERGRGLG